MEGFITVLLIIGAVVIKLAGKKRRPTAEQKRRPPRMWTQQTPPATEAEDMTPEDMSPERMQSEDMTPEDMSPLETAAAAQQSTEGLSIAQTAGHQHHDPTEGSIDLPEGSQEGTSHWMGRPLREAPAAPEEKPAPHRRPGGRITPEEMRRAVVLSEVLDRPLALRTREKR